MKWIGFGTRRKGMALFAILLISLPILATLPACADTAPIELQVSDVTRGTFTISWWLDEPLVGGIHWGETTALGEFKPDNRGAGVADTTHRCKVGSLKDDTTYYFTVESGGVIYGDSDGDGDYKTGTPVQGGTPWSVTTSPIVQSPWPISHLVWGRVFDFAGSNATDTIVYLYAVSGGYKSSTLSTFVDEDASFFFELSGLKDHELKPFQYAKGDLLYLQLRGGHRGYAPATGWHVHTISVDLDVTEYLGDWTLLDPYPPEISGIPQAGPVYIREPIQIEAAITDNLAVTSATLHYKGVNDTAFASYAMVRVAGNASAGTWRATVPAETYPGQVEYYFNATDGTSDASNGSALAPLTLDVIPRPLETVSTTLQTTPSTVDEPFDILVQLIDDEGFLATWFDGTVTFNSSDDGADLPANYTFSPAVDMGQHVFSGVRLYTSGAQQVWAGNATVANTIQANVTLSPGPLALLELEPPALSIHAGANVTFTAQGYDLYGNEVAAGLNWSVQGGIGTITPNGTFTAQTAGSGIVVVTNGSVNRSAPVEVGNGPESNLSAGVLTRSVTVNGDAGVFEANVTDSFGNPVANVSVQWTLETVPAGSSFHLLSTLNGSSQSSQTLLVPSAMNGTSSVALHVGEVAGDYVLRASVAGLNGSPVRFTVDAQPDTLTSLDITPGQLQITVGEPETLEATAYDDYGNGVPVVPSWASTIGSVDAVGVFTAPILTGTGWVNATWGGLSASITVQANPGPPARLEIRPQVDEVAAGNYQQFEGFGYDSYNNSNDSWTPSWATNLGDITPDGLFLARTYLGTGQVEMLVAGLTAYHYFSVVPDNLVHMELLPNVTEVALFSGENFTAQGYDKYGNPKPVYPTWEATLGEIDERDGTYEATTLGMDEVRASYASIIGTLQFQVIDRTHPAVIYSRPADDEELVPRTTGVNLLFSEEMNMPTVESAFGLFGSSKVNGEFVWNGRDNVTFLPGTQLAFDTEYTVSIDAMAQDLAGNGLLPFSFSFTTVDDWDNDTDGKPNYQDLDDDNDGIPDEWEEGFGLDPLDPSDARDDSDGDGLSNLNEYTLGTDPTNPDSDGDGVLDGTDKYPLNPAKSEDSPWEGLIGDPLFLGMVFVLAVAIVIGLISFAGRKHAEKVVAEIPSVESRMVRCPACDEEFGVLEGSDTLRCPYCGIEGQAGE